jgi:cytochrome c5
VSGRALLALAALAVLLGAAPADAKPPSLPADVKITLPQGLTPYDGPGAAVVNNNCLGCHSKDMVLNQPLMAKAAWAAEVAKMRAVYKAPVAEQDMPAIVDYLVRIKGAK